MGQDPPREVEQAPTSQELLELQLKPKRWPIFAGLGVLVVAAAAVGGVLLTRDTREPNRVLLALDAGGTFWQGSTAAARIVDEVAPYFEKRGFVAVGANDPQLLEKLASAATPEEAARITGAAFIVTGKLEPQLLEHKSGGFEVKAKGQLSLRHYRGEPTAIGEVSPWAFSSERETALRLAAENTGVEVFNTVLAGLLASAEVRRVLEGDDAVERGKLTSAKAYLEKRAQNEKRVAGEYEKLARTHAENERARHKATYLGPFAQRATLAAVTARGVLVKTDEVRTWFSPKDETLKQTNELERLYWLSPGAPPALVAEAIDIYSYPSASGDGKTVAFIEALASDALTLEVVRDGKRRRLLEVRDRLSEPKVSPSGARVALWRRSCARCPASLLVVAAEDGKEQAATDATQGALGGFAWTSDKSLAFLYRTDGCGYAGECAAGEGTEAPDARQQLVLLELDPDKPRFSMLYQALEGESLSYPSASADGQRVLMQRSTELDRGLALFDPSTREMKHLDVGPVAEPAISPDGKQAVYIAEGDVALIDLASLGVTALTLNPYRDRYPLFAPDGKRVLFERRDQDPVFAKQEIGVVASVPVP